jgi:hypothetical protein
MDSTISTTNIILTFLSVIILLISKPKPNEPNNKRMGFFKGSAKKMGQRACAN